MLHIMYEIICCYVFESLLVISCIGIRSYTHLVSFPILTREIDMYKMYRLPCLVSLYKYTPL